MRRVASLLGLVMPLLLPAQTPQAVRRPIIDMHMHALTMEWARWAGVSPQPHPVARVSPATSDEAVLRETLAAMDRYTIVTAVLSGRAEDVERWVRAAPSRFIPSAMFSGAPTGFFPTPSADSLRSDFLRGRFKVLGEITAQYEGLAPGDPRLEPFFALAEELDIPVGIHTGIAAPRTPHACCPAFRLSLGNPLLLEEVLVRHPKLRLYIMHAGVPYLQETLALMWMCPQVYLGLSVHNWVRPRQDFHAYLKALVDAGLGQRLMWGSDQMVWPGRSGGRSRRSSRRTS